MTVDVDSAHASTNERVTVISGSMKIGIGDKLDEASAQKNGTG
jgi:hypothetical protein